MSLVRWRPRREWDPFAGLFDLRKELTDMLSPTRWSEHGFGEWAPPVNLYADEEKVVVQAEVPGLKENEVDVSLHNGVLTIKGERKHEAETKKEGYHSVERAYGSFHRAVAIPAEVDASKASAELKEGVLKVTLPKVEEAKAKQIEIESK